MGNFHHTDNYTQLCGPKLLSLSVVLFFYPEETVAGNELLQESILSILSIQAAFVDSHFSHAFDQRYVPSLELSHCRRSLHIPYIELSISSFNFCCSTLLLCFRPIKWSVHCFEEFNCKSQYLQRNSDIFVSDDYVSPC